MQNRIISAIVIPVVLCLVLSVGRSASAHQVQYEATLTGPNEFPANASPGTGHALVTVDLDLATMRVEVQFSGLTGTTTASHIHGLTSAPFFQTAGVMTTTPTFAGFPSGVTAGTYDNTLNLGLASSYNPAFVTAQGSIANAMNTLLLGLSTSRAYLNIHSTTFPGGEIRGFFTEVPEPTSLSLLTAGLLLVARRQR
jgi:hypothetical protein